MLIGREAAIELSIHSLNLSALVEIDRDHWDIGASKLSGAEHNSCTPQVGTVVWESLAELELRPGY